MKRLLIVGSDTFTVEALRFALEYSSGVSLFGVVDGQGSVRHAVREANPDVVVVDGLGDPREGPARVREIREEATEATILLLSAALGDDALNEVLDAGAIVCLSRSRRLSEPDEGAQHPAEVSRHAAVNRVVCALVNGHVNGNGHRPAALNGTGSLTLRAIGAQGDLRAIPSEAAPGAGSLVAPGAPACPLTRRELEILRAVTEGHTNARIARDLWVTENTVKFHLYNVYRKLGVSNRTQASRYALVNNLVGASPESVDGAEASPPEIAA